ncbi:MAG: hypothetical protein GC168_04330 [Candidatus Hydrogenedens sp.]|nr:hypothetical protein [Candidatus Hydrogenedens sp.]
MSEFLHRHGSRLLACMGVGLLGVLVWRFGWRTLLAELAAADPVLLAAMVLLTVTGFWMRAWKWRIALGPGTDAVRVFFLAKVLGSWTPGRAGELGPLLMRRHRSLRMGAWIVADRCIEVWMTLGFGAFGLLGLRMLDVRVSTSIAAGFLLLTVLAMVLSRVDFGAQDAQFAGRWARAGRLLHALRGEARDLGSKSMPIVFITAFAKASDVAAVMCLCRAFGYDAGFLLVSAARCAHALVSAVPLTPDASGVPYLAQAALLHREAGMPLDVLTAALALEALLIYAVLHASAAVVLWRAPEPMKENE